MKTLMVSALLALLIPAPAAGRSGAARRGAERSGAAPGTLHTLQPSPGCIPPALRDRAKANKTPAAAAKNFPPAFFYSCCSWFGVFVSVCVLRSV